MSRLNPAVHRYVEDVTSFLFVEDTPQKSDIIFLPGAIEAALAQKASWLYHQGFAPIILPSGLYSKHVGHTDAMPQGYEDCKTELAYLSRMLVSLGVPASKVWREDQATYTWENALFSRRETDRQRLCVRRAILCCKPFHARRALLYYQMAYPEAQFFVCPASISGQNQDDWYLSSSGRDKVFGELTRLGSQVVTEVEHRLTNDERKSV